MELLRVGPLPDEPLAAAADFHARILPGIEATLSGGADPLTLVFLPGDHRHRAWRLAVTQSLARTFAPSRVNAVETDDETAITAACEWLGGAGAVTGQLLPLDGTGAGPVL